LKLIEEAPSLRRINGIGFCLLGTMKDEILSPKVIKMYWFTAFWIPLFPLCVYLVSGAAGDAYRVFAKMELLPFHSIYRGKLGKFYGSVFLESVLWLAVVIVALSAALLARYAIHSMRH
ncbi:MAG: hypothetical protein WA791_02425, partial [Rhodomicrobium sp.]